MLKYLENHRNANLHLKIQYVCSTEQIKCMHEFEYSFYDSGELSKQKADT